MTWVAFILLMILYVLLLRDEGFGYEYLIDMLDWFNGEHEVRRMRRIRGTDYYGWILLIGGIFYYLFYLDATDKKQNRQDSKTELTR